MSVKPVMLGSPMPVEALSQLDRDLKSFAGGVGDHRHSFFGATWPANSSNSTKFAVAIALACSLVGSLLALISWRLVGELAPPSVPAVQAAYDVEAFIHRAQHDKTLKIVDAKCHAITVSSVYCHVTFTADAEPGRLFVDGARLERRADDWKLTFGLCRGLR
jgi:hypothetical protein